MIIGGNEDRDNDKPVLRRIVALSERAQPKIVVITAASAEPDVVWQAYDGAFEDLGVRHRQRLDLPDRHAADHAAHVRTITEADIVFMTGGDQTRLMSALAGSRAAVAIREGFAHRGQCVAGTSAGASVMSEHMMASGEVRSPPTKDMVRLARGLGLLHGVIIDQHFSERGRLPRLFAALAHHPPLMGLGIDEDTALVVRPFDSIEVIGSGAVTVVDGSSSTIDRVACAHGEALQLEKVVVHLLPAGGRYTRHAGATPVGPGIATAVHLLTTAACG
ncbi:cyanophycinase [Ideonella sp. DXS29W]|uniref:Cyanophycinase n=1 Tax=Ideonella lacteola TaxID=2984193 RepID=A0ABU9BS11_9BURK